MAIFVLAMISVILIMTYVINTWAVQVNEEDEVIKNTKHEKN